MRLIIVFVAVPLIELYLLLKLADLTSGGFTFTLVIVTGIVGASLARHQGWGVVNRLQEEKSRGELPAATLVDGLMIFVAGALLLTPGILTDVVGFSLLVPACRRMYRGWLIKWYRRHATVVSSGHRPTEPPIVDANTIDAQVISRSEPDDSADP